MDSKILIAILIVGLLVVGVNGALFLVHRRGATGQHIRMWQKAAKNAQNPWGEEEKQLKELSNLVAQYKEKPGSDETEKA